MGPGSRADDQQALRGQLGPGLVADGQTNAFSYALVKLRERINWDADFRLKWKMETDAAGTNENAVLGSAA